MDEFGRISAEEFAEILVQAGALTAKYAEIFHAALQSNISEER